MKRFAERVAPVAQTTHPTQAGLARVLNSLVVPPFLRRGNLWACAGAQLACGASHSATREFVGLCGCSTCLWRQPFCDAGFCVARVGAWFTLLSGLFYFAASSCKLMKRNSRASNNPKSLSFKAGIGSNAKKLSVINGALNVAPTSRVIVS